MTLRTGDALQRLVANARAVFPNTSLLLRNVASAAGKTGFKNVQTYRLYCLDGMGKVASAEWIEAEDDAAAIDVAGTLSGGRACELWQNHRLVARIERPADG
jgi:hypothetical protein